MAISEVSGNGSWQYADGVSVGFLHIVWGRIASVVGQSLTVPVPSASVQAEQKK